MRGRYDALFDALLGIVPIGIDFVVQVSSTAFVGHGIDWWDTGRVDCRSHLAPRALII